MEAAGKAEESTSLDGSGDVAARNDPQSITFMDLTGSKQVIARRNIADLAASQTSLMPEGLTSALTDEQLRDLLAYFITHPWKTL